MAGLIAKKLARLPVGTSVSLSYGDGTVHQETVDGVVTDNDFSENIEIKTSSGQELLLSYIVIRSLKINDSPGNIPGASPSAFVTGTSVTGSAGSPHLPPVRRNLLLPRPPYSLPLNRLPAARFTRKMYRPVRCSPSMTAKSKTVSPICLKMNVPA